MPLLLASLAAQAVPAGTATLCVQLDGCTDSTAALLHDAAIRFPWPIVTGHAQAGPANAGAARRAAMALGLERLGDDPHALLLTTDGDSRPRPGWIAAAVRALGAADVVAGRTVRIGGGADAAQARVERYLDRLHAFRRRVDPVPWEAAATSHFSGAANLGFRAGVYRALGGFAPLPSGEDAALLDDAARAGYRVRRDADVVVDTSSRRHGRAPGGLAAALRSLDAGEVPHVAHPDGAAWQYRAHRLARSSFEAIDAPGARERLGGAVGLSADHVLGVWRDCPNGEAFAMRIVPAAPGHGASVPVTVAEAALARLEAALDAVPA